MMLLMLMLWCCFDHDLTHHCTVHRMHVRRERAALTLLCTCTGHWSCTYTTTQQLTAWSGRQHDVQVKQKPRSKKHVLLCKVHTTEDGVRKSDQKRTHLQPVRVKAGLAVVARNFLGHVVPEQQQRERIHGSECSISNVRTGYAK